MKTSSTFIGGLVALCTPHCAHSPAVAPVSSATDTGQAKSVQCAFPLGANKSDHYSILKGALAATELLAQVSEQPFVPSSPEEARTLICKLFEDPNAHRVRVSPPALCTVGEASFPATKDGLDGTWHFIGFPGEVFVAMYEPPQRDLVYLPTTWTLRREGAFAIHEVSQPAFICPTAPQELCVSWSANDDHEVLEDTAIESPPQSPTRFFCPDEKALPCAQRGYNSEVFIVDPTTARTVSIGPLTQAEEPNATARPGSRTVTVSTSTCSSDIPF